MDCVCSKTKIRNTLPFRQDIAVKYSSFENECTYMSHMVASICEEYSIPCKIIRINPGFEKDANFYKGCNFHDICIINLNQEYFLVDCTYRQFFMLKNSSLERIGIPYIANTTPGIFMTLNSTRQTIAHTVLEMDGYL